MTIFYILIRKIDCCLLYGFCEYIVTVDTISVIDRHHGFKSGNISKTEGGLILPHLCSSLMISMKFDRYKKEALWSKSILQGACHAYL